jgi:2-amino-4-hydroxy-6-hydroxymethyldihydropteridine diphosphokinase
VLKPMVDIASDVRHPVNGKTMRELWASFPAESEPLTAIAL